MVVLSNGTLFSKHLDQ